MGLLICRKIIMGTLKEKLAYLVNWRKKLVDIVNSKTSTTTQTTGSVPPFYGKYSSINMTDVKTNFQCFFPSGFPMPILVVYYESTLDILWFNTTNGSYLNIGNVTINKSRTNTGLYTLSFTMPNIGSNYCRVYPIINGSYQGTDTNSQTYACIWNTSSNYVTTGSTVSFKIRTADDASANDGGFSIMIFALF